MWAVGDVDIDHLESEVANTGQEAVQRCVVHECAGEDGLAVHLEVVERRCHGGADRSLEPDEYVFHDRASDVRVEVSLWLCDGVVGAHTTAIVDHPRAMRHPPDGVNFRRGAGTKRAPMVRCGDVVALRKNVA